MNEEQAVLNFFAQKENLPLALSVANQVDGTRQKLNHDFWLALSEHIVANVPGWRVSTTENRNATECLVGLCLQPEVEQKLYLCPLLEQQYIGDTQRIYYGLMWSAMPTLEQKQLSVINTLRNTFQKAGFKSNEHFLAWQWTSYYPRNMDFLLRFSTTEDALLHEAASLMQNFLVTHRDALHLANTTLRESSRNAATSVISLDKLRANLER